MMRKVHILTLCGTIGSWGRPLVSGNCSSDGAADVALCGRALLAIRIE
jgi:hypothetical protein